MLTGNDFLILNNLVNMSYDQVKKTLKKQVKEKKVKVKQARRALRSIKTEEKKNKTS